MWAPRGCPNPNNRKEKVDNLTDGFSIVTFVLLRLSKVVNVSYKKEHFMGMERAQKLRACVDLAQDVSLGPTTHIKRLTTTCDPSSGRSHAFDFPVPVLT